MEMFSLNFNNAFASDTYDEEMNISNRQNKKGRQHIVSDDSQSYKSTKPEDSYGKSTDVPVKPFFKKSWGCKNKRLAKRSRRFQKELEKTTHKVNEERSCRIEEDNEESTSLVMDFDELLDVTEDWLDATLFDDDIERPAARVYHQEKQAPRPARRAYHQDKQVSRMRSRQLEKELLRTRELLETERSEKRAIKNRLEKAQCMLEEVKMSQFQEESLKGVYRQRMCKLQEEVRECQNELDKERIKGNQMLEELEVARQENKKCQEKMRLLMFNHIPTASPRFRDIGPVDYEMNESGDRVGSYELGTILGEGHYGMVQMGTDTNTNEEYAIKVLSKDRVARFKDLQQIATEVHVLKRYPHPNIIHLETVVHASQSIYLVTELCSMDIHKYHSENSLSEDRAMHVILGILRPIEYLHSHGICHLDLKPENVLLTRSVDMHNVTHEHIRLCDFGLVNMAKHPDQSLDVFRKGYACGTPGFFAPEMILKKEFEGRLADMWSLGCIILELTLGFVQEWLDSYELVNSDSSGFQLGLERCLADISPENYPHHQNLLDLIHRCLQIEPMNRISSRNALQHPWLGGITYFEENRQDSSNSQRSSMNSRNRNVERNNLNSDIAVMC